MCDYDECKPYVNHLLAEHRRLHGMLGRARAAVRQMFGPDHDAMLLDLARTLEQVRSELRQHFTEEEQGDCLEEAVSRCPRVSADAERIKGEHVQLLADLDGLIAESKDGPDNFPARFTVERDFDALSARLHAHEAAENAILRAAFGAGINGDDAHVAGI